MSVPSQFWSFPKRGAVPDLTHILEAETLAELAAATGPHQGAVLDAIEAERDRTVADARQVAAGLRAKGIHMDVDAMLRGSLWDRLSDKWYDLLDWWEGRVEPVEAPPPDDVVFSVALALAMTRPTGDIAAEYDDIDAEVDRMVEALSRQITVAWGRAPLTVTVPHALIDDLAEQDDFSEEGEILLTAQSVVAYWPPIRSPAMALLVEQEDGGLAITVSLVAHGAPAHGRFAQILADHGGSLS
ncbi:hypothetical protein A8B78_13070 [Jannaschia sp. EhC01]|nr:hypothetical protein A8B78_13070 [Jannaschia sp. EhC01]